MHENINGVNYTVRERLVNGKSQTIYYNDGKAYIKALGGELQPLVKIKDSIFSKAEYILASEYDSDGDGTISVQEQKKNYGQLMLMNLNLVLGEKWADTLSQAKISLNDIVSKYIKGDISAKNETEINKAKETIIATENAVKEDLLKAIEEALHRKSANRANENIQLVTELCDEYKANADTFDEDEKKQYAEAAKKMKHLLSIEQKMHPQNKELNDSIQKTIDLINETFNLEN